MAQDAEIPSSVNLNGSNRSVVDIFKYLRSTISRNLSLDVEINARIGKAVTVMAKLNKRVWQNINLTINTRLKVYQSCVTSILLYGSETWTPYARQEAKLNSFHLPQTNSGYHLQDRIPNTTVLEKAKCSNIHALLSQRRLRWLGHICRMGKGRIPKDLLYGELEKGTHKTGCPLLHFKDVCKKDMVCNHWHRKLEVYSRRSLHMAASCKRGNQACREYKKHATSGEEKYQKSHWHSCTTQYIFQMWRCDKDCHLKIGLFSYQRCCSITQVQTHSLVRLTETDDI